MRFSFYRINKLTTISFTIFQSSEYKPIASEIVSRFGETSDNQVDVKEIEGGLPNFTKILLLPKDSDFSLFNDKHSDAAATLIELFMSKIDI